MIHERARRIATLRAPAIRRILETLARRMLIVQGLIPLRTKRITESPTATIRTFRRPVVRQALLVQGMAFKVPQPATFLATNPNCPMLDRTGPARSQIRR